MKNQHNGNRQANLLVLGKITSILDAFTLARPVLNLSEIRELTGLPASTAQRLVASLVSVGFLDREDNSFRIGVRMAYWAAPATQGVEMVRLAQPELDALRDQVGESVALFGESAGHRVCIALAETLQILRIHMRVGTVSPLHAGSSGRVLLAWTPGLLEKVADDSLAPLTTGTITDPDRLRTAVRQAVTDHYAITQDERETGSSGVSAPVFGAGGTLLAALNVFGPSSRLTDDRLEELVPFVVEGAERLTRIIGGRHPNT